MGVSWKFKFYPGSQLNAEKMRRVQKKTWFGSYKNYILYINKINFWNMIWNSLLMCYKILEIRF